MDTASLNHAFSIKYSDKRALYTIHHAWEPDKTITGLAFTAAEEQCLLASQIYLDRWLRFYQAVTARDSEALCHMPMNQALLEAIAILGGHASNYAAELLLARSKLREEAVTKPMQRQPPTIYSRIELFAEMDLHYSPSNGVTASESPLCYTGRVDYAVGILHNSYSSILEKPRHASLLIVVEAKKYDGITEARKQLLASAACISAARRKAGTRLDCTTYGIAADCYSWVFLQIAHDGTVRFTKQRDIREVGWASIIKTIILILKHSAILQTPQNSPPGNGTTDSTLPTSTVTMDDGDWLSKGTKNQEEELESDEEDEYGVD
ncbi:hypothetical protein BDZ91DRAFT_849799 [Kalaharituber pfeilii]|nr:hypothetical protein BDZ91DRAFT_849799 [Kalaharituber pfeilii]